MSPARVLAKPRHRRGASRRPPPAPPAVAAAEREVGGPGRAAGLEAQARGEADGSSQIPPRVWAWVVLAEVMVALKFVTTLPKPTSGPLP